MEPDHSPRLIDLALEPAFELGGLEVRPAILEVPQAAPRPTLLGGGGAGGVCPLLDHPRPVAGLLRRYCGRAWGRHRLPAGSGKGGRVDYCRRAPNPRAARKMLAPPRSFQ